YFFFSSRRRHTRSKRDWSSDVCSSDLSTRISTIRTRSTTSISRRTPSRRAWSATGPIAWVRTRPRKSHARLWRRHASAARSGTKTTRSGTADRMTRQEEVGLKTVEDREVRFIRLWFTDVLGQLKSVAIVPAELEGAFAEGIGFDGSAVEGLSRVYEADMVLKPDPSTFSLLPWRGETEPTGRMF